MKSVVIASVKCACKAAGGQRALARLLGVSSSFVWQLAKGRRDVPIHHCQAIVELTEGQVTVQTLRPNDWHLIWPSPKSTTTDLVHISHYDPNGGII